MKPIQRSVVVLSRRFGIATIAMMLVSAVVPDTVAAQSRPAQTLKTVEGVACARIGGLGIDKQANLRAAGVSFPVK